MHSAANYADWIGEVTNNNNVWNIPTAAPGHDHQTGDEDEDKEPDHVFIQRHPLYLQEDLLGSCGQTVRGSP